MAFHLCAVGGLCNRIYAILGYRALHCKLDVVWEPNEHVSFARWSDVFEPLEGVTFRDHGEGEQAWWYPEGGPPWEASVRDLWPLASLQARIDFLVSQLGRNSAAIHVRRTDRVPVAERCGITLLPCEQYVEFAKGASRVYIATDNAQTQRKLLSLLPPGVACIFAPLSEGSEVQAETDHRRHTSLAHAVIDLFMCAHADRFLGTPGKESTFTGVIELLRRHLTHKATP